MELNFNVLYNLDLNPLGEKVNEQEFRNYFIDSPGNEHYKLLAYISQQYENSNLLDIGTYKGCSALALSYNKSNTVTSFDIGNFVNLSDIPSNIEFLIDDVTDEKYIDMVLASPFIMLDTVHDGLFERKLHSHLQNIKWEGLLLLDDINLNDDMREYWQSITEDKYDVSKYGHWSGTGLVYF
jgi:hypothetical protein